MSLGRGGNVLGAIPLVRFALECGLTARWLELFEDSTLALSLEAVRLEVALLDNAIAQRLPETADRLAEVKALLESSETPGMVSGKVLEQRCNDMSDGPHFYLLYRALSAHSHAGMTVTPFYVIKGDPDDVTTWRLSDRPQLESLGMPARLLCSALVLAGLSWKAIRLDRPATPVLDDAASRLHIAPRPTRTASRDQRERRAAAKVDDTSDAT